MSNSAVSANRLELLQIADAVAREKLIDPDLVIEAMEDSLGKAARSRYGAELDIRAHIDRKSGEMTMFRAREVVEEVEKHFIEIALEEAHAMNPEAENMARERYEQEKIRLQVPATLSLTLHLHKYQVYIQTFCLLGRCRKMLYLMMMTSRVHVLLLAG